MPPPPAIQLPISFDDEKSEKRTIPLAYPSTPSPSIYLNDTDNSTQDCETGSRRCAHGRSCRHSTSSPSRLRRLLIPIIVSLITLGSLLITLVLCSSSSADGGILFGWTPSSLDPGALIRRADGTTSGNSPLIDKKLYLIIIFVGLLLVVIAAIMLSAWCCKGAFQNPLCCPCYLCACCGGLACLECIGCGLCGEGFEAISQDG